MAELKITDFAHRAYSRLLLVEGPDDIDFVYALLGELSLLETIYLYQVGGKDNFEKSLTALINSSEFDQLEYLGIMRDADYNTDAFESIHSAIANANKRHPRHSIPVPDKPLEIVGEDLKVSIMILPDSGIEGMLENVILDVLADDKIILCVDNFITCLEEQDIELKLHVLPKAKVRIFLAGNALDATSSRDESEIWELRHMFKLKRWQWEHPSLEGIKAFLRQLAQ